MKYHGIIHIHSRHSYDGKISIKELRKLCLKNKLSFAILTEHYEKMNDTDIKNFVSDCSKFSDKKFLAIPGFEIIADNGMHILALGIKRINKKSKKIKEILKIIRSSGGVSVLAHPVVYKNNYEIYDIDGIEVWNTLHDNKKLFDYTGFKLFERIRRNKKIFAFCGLDMHNNNQFFGLKANVDATALTIKDIICSFKNGKFNFSYGLLKIDSDIKIGYIKKITIFIIKSWMNIKKIYRMLC